MELTEHEKRLLNGDFGPKAKELMETVKRMNVSLVQADRLVKQAA